MYDLQRPTSKQQLHITLHISSCTYCRLPCSITAVRKSNKYTVGVLRATFDSFSVHYSAILVYFAAYPHKKTHRRQLGLPQLWGAFPLVQFSLRVVKRMKLNDDQVAKRMKLKFPSCWYNQCSHRVHKLELGNEMCFFVCLDAYSRTWLQLVLPST